jgi:putative lipoprotein
MKQAASIFSRPGAWIVLLALIAGAAMTGDASGAGRLEGPTWLAEDIKGGGVIDNAQSRIAFAAGGKVTGSGGCNRLFGSATIAGDALSFGGIGTTRMACAPALMDQEHKFLAALAATRTFRFEGPYLKFYDAGGAELVRFTELR